MHVADLGMCACVMASHSDSQSLTLQAGGGESGCELAFNDWDIHSPAPGWGRPNLGSPRSGHAL
jgi:hypothetical protein